MDNNELIKVWTEKFKVVPQQINKLSEIPCVATAFNSNIDAIIKINGQFLAELIEKNNISLEDIENVKISAFSKETDVILGIVKCFSIYSKTISNIKFNNPMNKRHIRFF